MSHAVQQQRLNDAPIAEVLEASYDGGKTYRREVRVSTENSARAYARGLVEFVTHRSRGHEYPHGARFRWQGRELRP
jgi:hypothetical protein